MWMEIWIHSIGWDTNFISLNPVNLNPLLNAGLLFVGCAIFPIKFLIHPFLPKPASILSLYPVLVLWVQPLLWSCLCSLGTTSTTYTWEWGRTRDKILLADQESFRETLRATACCCFYGRRDPEKNLSGWALRTC